MMEFSNQTIDHHVLQDTGENSRDVEWSATTSVLDLLDTSSSNSQTNNTALKEYCANSSDSLKNKDDFMVIESTSSDGNNSNYNADDSEYPSTLKATAFQKRPKPQPHNLSYMFANILDDDSRLEIAQNSVCLSRFQKRIRLLTPNEEDFVEIDKSNDMDSVENSINSPKLWFSKKIKAAPDQVNISKVKKNIDFKKPSDTSLVNNTFNKTKDISKTNILPLMFTQKTIDMGTSAFDNIINDSSTRSDISLNNKSTLLNNTSVSNINGISMCSTLEMPSLNHTYDISIKGNSTQIGNVKNNTLTQPINETYTLENDSMSNKLNSNASFDLINTKKTLSDTYTIENDGLKFVNKSISTLADMSNICNQSKSPVRKCNFVRKLQLDEVSPNYNIINDLTDNEKINETENNISKRFKFKKTFQDVDSMVFDNIITTSQENEISILENINISNLTNCSIETSNIHNLVSISSGSKSKQNMEESIDKTLTEQSNIFIDELVENDKTQTSLLLKYNTSNIIKQPPTKFNFINKLGSHSLSFQENTENYELSKLHSISLNTALYKTSDEQNNIHHRSSGNVNIDSHSHVLKIQDNQSKFQKLLKLDGSLSSEPKDVNHEVNKTSLSQTPGSHFTGKPNLNAHSKVFNDLINDDSLNSNTSMTLNISKQIKFKNHNKPKSNSIVFDNIITNSQESNSTSTINKSLGHSVLCDQSKIQSDEISMFANTDELYNSKSRLISDKSFKNLENSKIVNIDESDSSDDECSIFNKTDSTLKHSIVNSHYEQKDSLKSEESVNNRFLPNISAGLLDNYDSPNICRKNSTSNSLLIHENTQQTLISNNILDDNNSIVLTDTKLDGKSMNSFNNSSSSTNDGLTLYYNSEIESVRSLRNNSKRFLISRPSTSSILNNDGLVLLNNTIKTPEIDESSKSSQVSKDSISSISNDEELTLMDTTNGTLEQNKSSLSQSKRSTLSNSRALYNTSSNSPMLEDSTNNVNRITTRSLKQKSQSFNNVQSSILNISDGLPESKELIMLNNTDDLSLEQKESTKNQSKSSLASKHSTSSISNIKELNSVVPIDSKLDDLSTESFNYSSRSTSNNEGLTLNDISKIESVRSLRNHSKRFLTSRPSTSSTLNKDRLILLNNTIKSPEIDGLSKSSLASKHSTSSTSNIKELNSVVPVDNKLDDLSTESFNYSSSSTSNNEGLTLNDISKIESVRSLRNHSKRFLTSRPSTSSTLNNDGLVLLNNTIKTPEIDESSKSSQMSKHSINSKSNDKELTLMDTTNGTLERNKSSISQSKKSTLSNSRALYNSSSNSPMLEDSTNNVNRISTRSLKQKSQSFNNVQSSISNITDGLPENKELITLNNTVQSLEQKECAKIQSKSLLTSKHSTSSKSNDKDLTLMDATNGTLEQNKLSISQSKKSTLSNSRALYNTSSNSPMLEDSTNNVNRISTRSLKQKSKSFGNVQSTISNITDGLPENEELIMLNNTVKSLEQKEFANIQSKSSLAPKHSTSSKSNDKDLTLMDATNGILGKNKSLTIQSKKSTLNNSRDLYNTSSNSSMLENSTNVNKISTRSLKQKCKSFGNVQSTISNIDDGLPENEELIMLNNTVGSLEQNTSSINHLKRSISKCSPDNSIGILNMSKNALILEAEVSKDNAHSFSRVSTCSLEQKKHSIDYAKPSTSKMSDSLQKKTKLSSTRVKRSNSKKNASSPSNVIVDNDSDDSTFWTTLSEDYISSKSNTQSAVSEFEKSKSNILAVTEYIVNTIGMMSINKQKSTHPGAFELEDPIDRPLTRRSSIKNSDRSLSILTRAIPLNNTSESICSSQSLHDSIIDLQQAENVVKEKFKSLYNKESWNTKRLYSFVIGKLYPKYNIYSIKYTEKFIKYLVSIFKIVYKNKVDKQLYADMLRYHMARYGIIKDTFDYIEFLTDYIPKRYHDELIPGWDLETSEVKFDSLKMFIPIMEDEEFLNRIMKNLEAA